MQNRKPSKTCVSLKCDLFRLFDLNEPLTLPCIGIRESESSYVSDFKDLNEKLLDISSLKVNKWIVIWGFKYFNELNIQFFRKLG